MIHFDEVIPRIKEILGKHKRETKILDKDIALALNLNPQYYAVIKKRKKIPYEAISHFSASHNLNMNWILIAQKPKYLT
jgi:hypothetical protein